MVKIRYFILRSSLNLRQLREAVWSSKKRSDGTGISPFELSSSDVLARYTLMRYLDAVRLDEDGSEYREKIPSIESYTIRFFQRNDAMYVCVLEPPRGGRVVSEALAYIFQDQQFFFEPISITHELVLRHVKKFDIAVLVSAKIRDFKAAEGAIGRLEISSKTGLAPEIAPFLIDREYKIDALAYEVTQNLVRGLIYYSSNGTVRISGPLVEEAFPLFESCL